MQDPRDTMLSGILDTPTVWLQLDTAGESESRAATEHILCGSDARGDAIAARGTGLSLGGRLRQAYDLGEFTLAYQPFVNARTRRVQGSEALLRWTDPLREASGPDQFVPVLERTGLIIEVGEWALRQACQDQQRLGPQAEAAVVSVNLSPRQFTEAHLVDRIAGILRDTGLPPQQLELEVTESMLEDVDRAIATLCDLRDLGVCVLIDDFGMGYSSLSHLKRLPVAGLKLDRSFVSGMLTSRPDRLITESIIRLAHELGLEVVAEGVEDLAHEDWLREHGVTRLQGFLYSMAVPAAAFAELQANQPYARPPVLRQEPARAVSRRRR